MKAKDFRKLLHDDTRPCEKNLEQTAQRLHRPTTLGTRSWHLTPLNKQDFGFYTGKYYTTSAQQTSSYTKWASPTRTNATCASWTKLTTSNTSFSHAQRFKPVWRMVEQEISKRTGTRLDISVLIFLDNTHNAQEQQQQKNK